MVLPLYASYLKFTEKFRRTDVFRSISCPTSIHPEGIGDIGLATPGGTNQDYIKSLADVLIVRQALEQIAIQVPIRQILYVPQKSRWFGQLGLVNQSDDIVVVSGVKFGISQ